LTAHREELLRAARRWSPSAEAAEDAVHEALARAAQRWDTIDERRLGAWLNAVTSRICADQHRLVALERRHWPRLVTAAHPPDAGADFADRCEDEWLARQVETLPSSQQRALRVLAEEGSIPATAARLGVSRQAAEGLVKRARASVRARLAATLGVVFGLRCRRRVGVCATGLAAAALTVVVPLLPPGGSRPHQPSAAAPSPHHVHLAARTGGPTDGRRAPDPATRRSTTAHRGARATTRTTNERRIRPPVEVHAGPATVHDGGTVIKKPRQELLDSARECLHHVEIDRDHVGCDPA
jgi:RNA polymerase sigma factor (sigma-70 family)